MEVKKTPTNQNNPKQKEHAIDIVTYHLRLYCRAIVANTAWWWTKSIQVDQWGRQRTQMYSHGRKHLLLNKAAKTTHQREDVLFDKCVKETG